MTKFVPQDSSSILYCFSLLFSSSRALSVERDFFLITCIKLHSHHIFLWFVLREFCPRIVVNDSVNLSHQKSFLNEY